MDRIVEKAVIMAVIFIRSVEVDALQKYFTKWL